MAFSSGVDNSDWNMLAVTIYDEEKAVDWRLCLVPKSDYKVIDTWYAMGMIGTGSKDIEVKEVFVPERHALALARCRGAGASGRKTQFGPAIPRADRRLGGASALGHCLGDCRGSFRARVANVQNEGRNLSLPP